MPNEIEKLTIKEAAQLGKLQNNEEDYVNIYSRIHAVHPEQARDEPSQLQKLKEFLTTRRLKRNPRKSGLESSLPKFFEDTVKSQLKHTGSNPDFYKLEFTPTTFKNTYNT